jgi:hypothetical protein
MEMDLLWEQGYAGSSPALSTQRIRNKGKTRMCVFCEAVEVMYGRPVELFLDPRYSKTYANRLRGSGSESSAKKRKSAMNRKREIDSLRVQLKLHREEIARLKEVR